MHLLRGERRRLRLGRQERLGRFVVGGCGRHRHQLTLGIAQGGQPPAEHAPGVDADGPVQPLRLGDGRVAVDDHRRAAVVLRPGITNGQAVFVRLPGRVAVEGKVPHLARAASLHVGGQAGVRDDQLAVVEHVVADQAVDEVDHACDEAGRFPFQLGERLGETVRDADVSAAKLSHQLHVVVAGDAQRRSVCHHAHDQTQDVRRLRSAIDEIAEEDGLSARRGARASRFVGRSTGHA